MDGRSSINRSDRRRALPEPSGSAVAIARRLASAVRRDRGAEHPDGSPGGLFVVVVGHIAASRSEAAAEARSTSRPFQELIARWPGDGTRTGAPGVRHRAQVRCRHRASRERSSRTSLVPKPRPRGLAFGTPRAPRLPAGERSQRTLRIASAAAATMSLGPRVSTARTADSVQARSPPATAVLITIWVSPVRR
jgi:hypothetical protein